MMKFRENEDAVSPVIGVILMVAITVILAAVIAAFVFGMAGNIETQKNVVLTVKQIPDDQLQVTVQGGTDLSALDYLRIEVVKGDGSGDGTYYAYVKTDNKEFKKASDVTIPLTNTDPITVGSIFTSDESGGILSSGSDQVAIIGHFKDGSEQMLLNTFL